MDKYEFLYRVVDLLKNAEIILDNPPRSNPQFSITKKNKKIYLMICEVGIKPAKYPQIIFCGISPKIQKVSEFDNLFVIIIDYQPSNIKFILTKVDQTNYRRNKTDNIIFNFNRPNYGGFFNTEDIKELIKEIKRL